MNQATLIGIAVKPHSQAAMQQLEAVSAEPTTGLFGDYHSRGRRQVTVLFKDAWKIACAEAGADLPWTARRANLFVDGVTLSDCVGTRMQIGDIVLEVTGETKPCYVMDAAQTGLRQALTPDWRAGVTCKVVRGGTMRVGDAVTVISAETA